MAVRYRPMRPNDAKECVEIVAAHPFMGPRYGSGTTDLRTVWLSLLGREAFRAVVFEDGEDTQVRMMGVGVSAFVSHDFLLELKTPPFFWAGPEMAKRVLRGESPLLSDKQVRQANADGGLNLATENKIINQETSDGDRPNSPWTAWADGSWNSAGPPIRA